MSWPGYKEFNISLNVINIIDLFQMMLKEMQSENQVCLPSKKTIPLKHLIQISFRELPLN